MEEKGQYLTENDFDDFEEKFRKHLATKKHMKLERRDRLFYVLVEFGKSFEYEVFPDAELLVKFANKTKDISHIRYNIYALTVLRWRGRESAIYSVF